VSRRLFSSHLTELYKNYSTLPVPLVHVHQQNLILFIHKILHYPHKLPVSFKYYFKYYFNQNDDIHKYNTRLKDSIHLYRTNTDYGKRSSKYRAAKYYNDLAYLKKLSLNSMNPGDTIKHFWKTTYLIMNTDLVAYLPLFHPIIWFDIRSQRKKCFLFRPNINCFSTDFRLAFCLCVCFYIWVF